MRETCVPQSYTWGVEAQIDWYEAYADLAGDESPSEAEVDHYFPIADNTS